MRFLFNKMTWAVDSSDAEIGSADILHSINTAVCGGAGIILATRALIDPVYSATARARAITRAAISLDLFRPLTINTGIESAVMIGFPCLSTRPDGSPAREWRVPLFLTN